MYLPNLFIGNKNNTIKKNDKDNNLLKIRFIEFTTKNKENSIYGAVFNNDPIDFNLILCLVRQSFKSTMKSIS